MDTPLVKVRPDNIVTSEGGNLRTLGDYSLVNELLRNSLYNIPPQHRDKAVASIADTLDDPEASHVLKLRAVNTLATLDQRNLDVVKLAMPKRVEHFDARKCDDDELLELVKEVSKLMPKVISND